MILVYLFLILSVILNLYLSSKLIELDKYYHDLYVELIKKMYATTDNASRIAEKTDKRIKFLMKKFNLNE